MPEKHVIGNAQLWLGDCREIINSIKYDVLLCDPPYGTNGGSGGNAKKYGKCKYIETSWHDDEEYIKDIVIPFITIAISKAKSCGITPGIRCLMYYPKPNDIGCFYQPAAVGCGSWGFANFQPILYYGKDPRAGKGSSATSKRLIEAAEKNGHPCPKPIKAWEWLLNKLSNDNDIVFDPFMGSGTTGVACCNLSKSFIGCEIEPKYFDIACKRIEDAQRQGRLFE
jgi:site-specific DNA-methyltransferase (adenine-specific)